MSLPLKYRGIQSKCGHSGFFFRPRNFQRYRTNSDLVRPHPQRVPDSWRGKDNYFGDYRKGSRRPSERRPKERRRQGRREKSSDPTLNPYGGCFVACGILIFACALVNILFSAEHHYYGGWWAGFLVSTINNYHGMLIFKAVRFTEPSNCMISL